MAAGKEDLIGFEIRVLTTLDEFQRTLDVQKRIWGYDESDVVAPRLFGVYRHVGGSVIGAFVAEEMVGYALAFAGFKSDHRVYWHSHMTGVVPELQGCGIGRKLKLRQRAEALAAVVCALRAPRRAVRGRYVGECADELRRVREGARDEGKPEGGRNEVEDPHREKRAVVVPVMRGRPRARSARRSSAGARVGAGVNRSERRPSSEASSEAPRESQGTWRARAARIRDLTHDPFLRNM